MRSTSPTFLKLFALPLARSGRSHSPLFLLHAHRPRTPATSTSPPQSASNDVPLLTKATDKAADMWAGLGKGKEGGWKKRSYDFGERMMDKIEYEEWALKAIDTTLAPKPWKRHTSAHASTSDSPAKQDASGRNEPVELLFPPSLLEPTPLLDALKTQLEHREPHHRKAMWKCLLVAPLTTPFALLPVVPNFPLFYVLWRAWSHWRAWKASQYLLSLLSSPSSNLSLHASESLDSIYAPLPPATDDSTLLLTSDKVPKIVERFSMGEEEQKDLERAVGQSEDRLKQGIEREQKEKQQQAAETSQKKD
ncbi:hypothetical protein JCM10212_003883 [Sporobolomyces blumeae]